MTIHNPDQQRTLDQHNGKGLNGHNGHHGHPPDPNPMPDEGVPMPTKRNSIWPFLLDTGLVTMLVSWIIFRNGPVVVAGAVLAVVALLNWWREARADFSKLAD